MTSIKSISLYDTSNYRGSGLVLVGISAIWSQADSVRCGPESRQLIGCSRA